MLKKIFIFLFITMLATSCGKKGDPIYQELSQANEINYLKYSL